jgi:rod shape determining protein RodA
MRQVVQASSCKRYFRHFDITNLILTLSICLLGLLFVFSATYRPEQPFSLFFKKQVFGIVTGFILYAFFAIIDYRTTLRYGHLAFYLLIGALAFTLIKGSIGMGAQRWLDLGLFKLQPSELAKILFPAYAVYTLQGAHLDLPLPGQTFIPILGMLGIGTFLIRKQPDLGTALLILFSGLIVCWLAGLSKKFFWGLIVATVCILPLTNHILKPYQRKRILVFLGYGSAQKERYQIEQARIAIGSGGLWGKGILKGTQNKLQFLPEGRTDFIFAVLCEELGLCGALVLLILYLLLFYRSFSIIAQLKEQYLQLLATGLLIPIVLSMLINISMVLGLLPVVGIPLPLMSYGISNLWVTLIAFGWLQNIAMQRLYRSDL